MPIEAFLKDHLQHPQLVRLIDSATAQRGAAPRLGSARSSELPDGSTPPKSGLAGSAYFSDDYAYQTAQELEMETWLLLEYCDMGTLMVSQRFTLASGSHCTAAFGTA